MKNKHKVAVIGAGTGLSAALGLSQAGVHVSVFEASSRAGGHINSININGHILEGGAEFIGDKDFYPYVHRLFEYLGVQLDEFQLTNDFHTLDNDDHIISPPANFSSSKKNSCFAPLLSCFCGFFKQPNLHVSMHTLVMHLKEALNTYKITVQADNIPSGSVQTLEDFINTLEFMGDDKEYADKYLYPLLAAAWGIPIVQVKTFCAQYATHYLTGGANWYDAPAGLSTYIDKITEKLPGEAIQLNTAIQRIIPISQADGTYLYQLQKQDDTMVCDEHGNVELFNDVMTTVSAECMKSMLPLSLSANMFDLIDILGKVEYYDTTVVFHSDETYASEEGCVVHTRVCLENGLAANTACKHWKYEGDTPIFKTWVLPGQDKPNTEKTHQVLKYRHPIMDVRYYRAQEKLKAMQGQCGLWFGGILAGNNDSHESAITVAGQVAIGILSREGKLENSEMLNAVFHEAMATEPRPEGEVTRKLV